MAHASSTTTKSVLKYAGLQNPLIGLAASLIVIIAINSPYLYIQAMSWLRPADASAAQFSADDMSVPVSEAARIIVPKINVDAPIVYDAASSDEPVLQKALERGVVHYPGTALPGEQGNAVFVGHSSNDVWKPGDYKFVFAILDHLSVGDEYALNYQGTRYVYKVAQKTVVDPTDVSALAGSDGAVSTLITCTPTGTSLKRLIIRGQQASPSVVHRSVSTQLPVSPQKLPF